MKMLPLRVIWLGVAAFAAASGPLLRAQAVPPEGAQSDETVEMSPFVVQQGNESGYLADQTLLGSRSTKDLSDIPGTVSIIDSQMISDLNATNFSQVIDFGVAGVTQFQNFQDDMMIRGFRSQSMRDGIVNPGTNDPQPMYDVDRVEVIKGPAAMLLGTNAFLGGAVNYIPIAPTATPSGSVEAMANIDDRGKLYGRLDANSMGPLYKSNNFTVDYRLTLGGEDGDTDKAIESLKEGFLGGALTMYYGPNTTVEINFYLYQNDSYIYYDNFLDYDAYYNQHRLELSPLSLTFSSGLPSDAWSRELDGDLDVKFLTRLTEHGNLQIHYSYFDTGYNESIPRTVTYASSTVINRQYIPYIDNATNSVLQVDYLHHLPLFHNNLVNDFYAGVDYTADYGRDADNVYSLPAVNILAPSYSNDAPIVAMGQADGYLGPNGTDDREWDYDLSYYFQDNVSLLQDRINLIGGLRWFDSRSSLIDANYAADGGAYSTVINYAPLQVYKVGAVVKPVSWLSLYWTKATNQTPQSGFTNPASGPPVPYGNEVGELTEFGVKLKWKLGDRYEIYGDWDHFNMALTNVYTTDSNGELAPNGNIVTGVADDTSVGYEEDLGFRAQVGPGHFDIFATGYHANTLAAALGALETQAPGSPNKVYSFLGKYTWTDGPLKGLMFGGGAYGQGPRYELGLPIHTPTIIDLFAQYAITPRWFVQVNANDITNQTYIVRIATSALVEASTPGQVELSTHYRW